jgi:hypothetical protein
MAFLASDRPIRGSDLKTVAVILEYCGGARTDRLFASIVSQNPGATVFVLDNASPVDRADCVTHRNPVNSYIGNGIRDCIRLAESAGAKYLFYCVNDAELHGRLDLAEFERVLEADEHIVQLSCSMTPDSPQGRAYPWMASRPGRTLRQVRHADLIACMLRLDFIRQFGGFPKSLGGWGYSRELAYMAYRMRKKVVVCDTFNVHHGPGGEMRLASGAVHNRGAEMHAIYRRRYPGEPVLDYTKWLPLPDEEAELEVGRLLSCPLRR